MADSNSNTTRFPEGFLWGASISSHQTEGNNFNDWTEWEKLNAARLASEAPEKFRKQAPNWSMIEKQATDPQNYISGISTDHFRKFREDIALAKQLGLQALRFSVEWSRVEPSPNIFDQGAISHYREVVETLAAAGIEPVITLHHRTLPVWVRDQGGWETKRTVQAYEQYVTRMVAELPTVRFWMPINEPVLYVAGGYLGGVYPPQKKNLVKAWLAFRNLAAANNAAYQAIHKLRPEALVGMPHAAIYVCPHKDRWYNRLAGQLVHYFGNWRMLDRTQYDFIGVQYYTRGVVAVSLKWGIAPVIIDVMQHPEVKTDIGWEIYPDGLCQFLKAVAARYRKPIYITENGITDARDQLRADFIRQHLTATHRAMAEGADVRGYFHWSLLDNQEWDKGFWPRFGLVDVDRQTLVRTIRPSARVYADIIRNNGF
jgi:beta-glucosidase